jgi:SAM-dependent methyltransferase
MDNILFNEQLEIFINSNNLTRPEFDNNYYSYPCLTDDANKTSFDTHYVYHVAWALRKCREINPEYHVDLSSSINFVSSVSSFLKTKFYEFQPSIIQLSNLELYQSDITSHDFDIGVHQCISCMHVVEHLGLGRYGDILDANGDIKAINNIKKSLAPGGHLLFVVPVGKPSIYFNAHRVYSPHSIIKYFSDFNLNELYFIQGNDNEFPLLDPDFNHILNYSYGCGCFHFQKPLI